MKIHLYLYMILLSVKMRFSGVKNSHIEEGNSHIRELK